MDDQNINNEQNSENEENNARRNFLKFGAVGAGVAVAAVAGVSIVKKMEGTPLDHFPLPINEDYVRIDQRNQINTFVESKKLNDTHPERAKAFGNWNFYEKNQTFLKGPYRKPEEGQGQLERALSAAGFFSPTSQLGYSPKGMEGSNAGVATWKQEMLAENKYQFASKEEATLSIKSAAKLFGAVRCGVTPRDERWDYDPLYDTETETVQTWEDDFPFVPKSVIVVMVPMDYEAIATAPSWITDAATGDGYGKAIKLAGQMAIFMRQLGYQAVASMNDLGMNVPYAVAAGIGEAARNGTCITPEYGPRVRIAKIYTDFDYVEYTPPRDYGVASFCLNCMRCADSCPGEAITHGPPTWEPTYSSDPDNIWNASKGVLKFHNDSKKCFKFWVENDGGCASCIASCPYNKPEFWHHRLVDATNVISPGPVHSFMREMDILFGYGKTNDPVRVIKFWKSGDKI
jgi:reductive dehalogenase